MRRDFLKKGQEYISVVLFAFSAVLAVCIFVRLIDFYATNARAEQLVGQEAANGKLDPNEMDKFVAKTKELAEELKKRNLFAPAKEKGHPVKAVTGIFGDEALVNGKWYKVGERIADAEIISIGATEVKVRWNGNVKSFAPIAAVVSSGPKTVVKKKTEEEGDEAAKQTAKQVVTTTGDTGEAVEEDPFAWLGVELSESQREKLELVWSKIPDEFKEMMKQQWNSMTDEQKQEALDELDQMPMDVLEQELDEMGSRM